MWSLLRGPLSLSSLHSQACAEPGVQGCPPFLVRPCSVGCEFNSRRLREAAERFHMYTQGSW